MTTGPDVAAPAAPVCSVAADAAGDPREGSAPPADRWLLIEHPGPWGRLALTGSGIDPDVVAALGRWADATRARIVLIRRPGRAGRAAGVRRWFRVDARPGHESVRTGVFDPGSDGTDAGLVAAVETPGERHDHPIHLVCTHGRHDVCCAVRGRPLAAALAATDPDGTWECSHIGGCRFAPALVVLPHGFTFGGVPPADAPAVVDAYRDGAVDPRWLRGRSSLPPAVQAAQHHAREATGAVGVDRLRPEHVEHDDRGGWRVTFTDPSCTVVLAERHVDAGRPLTCAAPAPGRLRLYDLVAVGT